MLAAEILVGLATDTTVYLIRREKSVYVNILNFTIRASVFFGTLGSQGVISFQEERGRTRAPPLVQEVECQGLGVQGSRFMV